MRRLLHIALVLLLSALALSCRGPRKIERGDMEEIVYRMLLQDQIIRMDPVLRRQADTSLVYEPIFKEFGYTTEDFRYSLNYYLEEPEKMEKVMEKVASRLEKEGKEVRREIKLQQWREKMLRIYRMEPDTSAPRPGVRPVDTLRVRFEADSAYLHRELDSLDLMAPDSLLFVRDSL